MILLLMCFTFVSSPNPSAGRRKYIFWINPYLCREKEGKLAGDQNWYLPRPLRGATSHTVPFSLTEEIEVNGKERADLLYRSRRQIDFLRDNILSKARFIERVHLGFGGSHTVVTYPPLDSLEEIDGNLLLDRVQAVNDLNLYLHLPFCEFSCPFCHYDTRYTQISERENERNYLAALKCEIKNWKKILKGSSLDSLYIGGGTPTAISGERLLELLSLLDDLPRSEYFTSCIETSPLTATAADGRDKLAALINAGVNRISIGIQTFNEQLLRSARGHGQKVALDALEIVLGLVDNVNLDLIQDLPNQSEEHILEDLEFIERLRPAQVTWYIMRLQPGSVWYKRHMGGRLELGDSLSSVRKRILIREGMRQFGYKPSPGGRFIRDDRFYDRYKTVRAALDSTLLGLGVSAYSHGWGYFFRNVYSKENRKGIEEYAHRIRACGFAIDSGALIDEVENTAGRLVSGIRYGIRLPEPAGPAEEYLSQAKQILDTLLCSGLVGDDGEGKYSLSEAGFLFEEEILSLFYSQSVQKRLQTRNGFMY
jgi:oxygen-independent coproporphyrinogen III oxidase